MASESRTFTNSETIDNGSISTYVVENLSPGSYEFVVTSFNSAGVEIKYGSSPRPRPLLGAGQRRVLYTPTVEISCIIASGQGNQ